MGQASNLDTRSQSSYVHTWPARMTLRRNAALHCQSRSSQSPCTFFRVPLRVQLAHATRRPRAVRTVTIAFATPGSRHASGHMCGDLASASFGSVDVVVVCRVRETVYLATTLHVCHLSNVCVSSLDTVQYPAGVEPGTTGPFTAHNPSALACTFFIE